MKTLAELALEKVLQSNARTRKELFPILYEYNLLLPNWIYDRVNVWWLEYNRHSIINTIFDSDNHRSFNKDGNQWFPKDFGISEEIGYHMYNFSLEPDNYVPTGMTNLSRLLSDWSWKLLS